MIKSPSSPLNPYSLATQNQTLPDPEFNELIIADGAAADIRELLHRSPLPALLLDRVSEPLSAITNALQDSQVHTL
ncbi:MAG: hypothetical protein ACJAY7_001687, partial [Pseudohongiellaceae bacterium]